MSQLILLSNFEQISCKLSLKSLFVNALLIGLEGLQNSEVLGLTATDIARCLKKSIHYLNNNRTKEFCQNFSHFD